MKDKLMILVLMLCCTLTHAQTMDTMTDPRDGKNYKTVIIEVEQEDQIKTSITWMAENFNFDIIGSYTNNHSNEYGRLYTWKAAMEACPEGWHLPSTEDWDVLEKHFGGNQSANALKSTSGWRLPEMNGTNSSGFNAIPGGSRSSEGAFENIGNMGFWWTSTSVDTDKSRASVLNPNVSSHFNGIGTFSTDINNAYSCRCIKD